ncbi:GNAT family N-acetyltransferase [Rhodovarius crocodyli]|uniref:GNAT family N-acetyltransferase n=1 Tax=Rhodovarius crocodyli TaxID=1979269 RepID=A0A437MH57_9PROT|nr:GNAT family N-acetyltransferase [Rhodovarius crocodyli]RVT96977.1 GNAT family N-acetyltransferase [Rhodovarius crocodyli]
MMMLDRPIWAALTGPQAHLAQGDARAWRFDPAVLPFAAGDAAALAALPAPGEAIMLFETAPPDCPAGLVEEARAEGVQMVATRPVAAPADPRIEPLGPAEVAEMVALADLTKPGPIGPRCLELGGFWGIRLGGRIAAMAGERLRLPGHAEVSGVCTHPDHRGQGLAGLLTRHVAALIQARGETPFLHAYAGNTGAIGVYERLGFAIARRMQGRVYRRPT